MSIYRAQLVAVRVNETGQNVVGRADFAPTPSCATCKWAEVTEHHPSGFDKDELVCIVPSGGLAVDCAGPAEIYVKPTHGCVQWEGK